MLVKRSLCLTIRGLSLEAA